MVVSLTPSSSRPPNVTGVLHMGHMLNNTIQRYSGTPCPHGRQECLLGAGNRPCIHCYRGQGGEQTCRTRHQEDRPYPRRVLEACLGMDDEHGGIILKQLRKLGASCDWDRTAFTMDEKRSESVLKVFVDLYNKGLIYRGVRMVNWDPKALTALSDEEVIYKEKAQQAVLSEVYMVEGDPEAIVQWLLPPALKPSWEIQPCASIRE